jgi:hypothetical protein
MEKFTLVYIIYLNYLRFLIICLIFSNVLVHKWQYTVGKYII